MDNITEEYIKFAVSLPKNNERDALFQDIEITLKNQLLEMLDKFSEKYKETMCQMEYYTSYFTLQNIKNKCLNNYQDKIRSLQSYSFL